MAARALSIHIRRAREGDAEAIMAAFSTPRAMAGTLQRTQRKATKTMRKRTAA